MEEVLLKHKSIVEAAVVSKRDELRGEIPIGLVVVKNGVEYDPQVLEKELVDLIRKDIGPVAAFRNVIVVEKLPKTRSGKVLRGTMKKIIDGDPYKVSNSILEIQYRFPLLLRMRAYWK